MVKKSLMNIFSFGTIILPTLNVIACSQGSKQVKFTTSEIVTIQVEKKWKETYQKFVDDFKEEYAKDLENNKIGDIQLVETDSLQNEKTISQKGIRNELLADIFLIKDSSIKGNYQNLRKFSKPTWTEWAKEFKEQIGEETELNQKASSSVVVATKDQEMYGAPQNIEAVVAVNKKGITPDQTITKYSDLWMSAGYFNQIKQDGTTKFNLSQIVETNDEGKIINHFDDYETEIKKGFMNVLTQINKLDPKLDDIEAFNNDSSKAQEKIEDYFKANVEKTQALIGSWDIKDGKYLEQEVEVKVAPSDWNQWGKGWMFVLNKRINNEEATIAEKLIAYILNPERAVAFYKGANKISPLTKGIENILSSSDVSESAKSITKAVSKTNALPQPTNPAFDKVWDVYAKTIASKQNDLTVDISQKIPALVNDLTSEFAKNLQKDIK